MSRANQSLTSLPIDYPLPASDDNIDYQINFKWCQINVVNKLCSDNLRSLTNHDNIIIELSKCKLMLYKLQYNL